MLVAIKELFTTNKTKIGNHSTRYIKRDNVTRFFHFYYKNTLVLVMDFKREEFIFCDNLNVPKRVISSYLEAHEKFFPHYSKKVIE